LGTLPAFAQQASIPASSVPFVNASVVDFKDRVRVRLPGQAFSTPSPSEVLPPDSEITTGNGQIVLRLEDGSTVTVYHNAHLVLKQPAASDWQRLQLLLGRIKAEIQKRVSGAPPFQIGTPSAVIAVRGTRFYVEVDKRNTTEVDVEEGEVQLENAQGIGAPVLIGAGSSSRVGEHSAPEPVQPTEELQRAHGRSDDVHNNNRSAPNREGPPASPPHIPPAPRGNNKPR
jgi:ferric-dicitrate binding protein FerR (iron transport regulator)